MFECPQWTTDLYDNGNKSIISKRKPRSHLIVPAKTDLIEHIGSRQGEQEIQAQARNIASIWLAWWFCLEVKLTFPLNVCSVFFRWTTAYYFHKGGWTCPTIVQLHHHPPHPTPTHVPTLDLFFHLFGPSSSNCGLVRTLIFLKACISKSRQVRSVTPVSCRWLRCAVCNWEDPGQLWFWQLLIWMRSDLRFTVWARSLLLSGRDEECGAQYE